MFQVNLWWLLRSKVVHQRILEDHSATLYKDIDLTIAKLYNKAQSINDQRLKVLLYLEMSQAYLMYDRVQKVEEYLLKAKELAGLKLELTGIMGYINTYCIGISQCEKYMFLVCLL